MAKISPFITETAAPVLVQPQNQGNYLTTAVQLADQMRNEAGNTAEAKDREMRNDYVRAVSAQFQADIAEKNAFNSIFDGINQIGKSLSLYEENELKIRTQMEQESQKLAEQNYLVTGQIGFQEQWMNKWQELEKSSPADGKGFTENMNKAHLEMQKQLLDAAPSDEARLKMFQFLGQNRIKSLDAAINFEQKRGQEFRMNSAVSAVNSLTNQAMTNPVAVGEYSKQITGIREMLVQGGMDPNSADKFAQKGYGQVLEGFYKGQISSAPDAALHDLMTSDAKDRLDPDQFISLVSAANRASQEKYKAAQEAFKTHESTVRVLSGQPLDPSNKDDREAVDRFYRESIKSFKDPQSGKMTGDPRQMAGVILQVMDRTPYILPKSLVSDIQGNILNGSPQQKEVYSRILGEMERNPKLQPLLSQMDDKTVGEGLAMYDAVQSGVKLEEAAQTSRDLYRSGRADVMAANKKTLQSEKLLDDKLVDKQLDKMFGGSILDTAAQIAVASFVADGGNAVKKAWKDPSGMAEARTLYKSAYERMYVQTGDEKAAERSAQAAVQKTYAKTTINGDVEMMRSAPDLVHPGREVEIKSMIDDYIKAENTAQGLVNVEGRKMNVRGQMRDIYVSSVDSFGRDVAASNGMYTLFYRDENGVKYPLLDKDGDQVALKFDPGAGSHHQGVIKEKLDRMADIERLNKSQEETQAAYKKNAETMPGLTETQRSMLIQALTNK